MEEFKEKLASKEHDAGPVVVGCVEYRAEPYGIRASRCSQCQLYNSSDKIRDDLCEVIQGNAKPIIERDTLEQFIK